MNEKKKLGQYFTKKDLWLKTQIIDFIKNSNCTIAYDPFAGNGDLLKISNLYGIHKVKGLDIDKGLNWEINDSLKNIPHIDNAIIITNPPYLTKYSASRKKINNKQMGAYFKKHTDLYQLAIDKMLETADYVVAIVPETYINSKFFNDHLGRVYSVTVLTENPFDDSDVEKIQTAFRKYPMFMSLQFSISVNIRPRFFKIYENLFLRLEPSIKNVMLSEFANDLGTIIDMYKPKNTLEE